MEALNKLVAYLETLDRRQFKFHVLGFFTAIVLLAGLFLYYLAESKNDLIVRLQALNKLATKGCHIIDIHRRIVKDEQRLKQVLEQKRGFVLQAFFEQICRDLSMTPEAGWAPKEEHISDVFDEIILTATFKNVTSDKVVKSLNMLNKEEIVYIKDFHAKNNSNKTITISVTIATKRYKSSIE
ncbi:hypothetical protein FJ365_00190 [Candidatus Dependentiae bacterium]|nr:hypothetical protein [Candidatus Dependentiae bacterium]